jgi:DNA-binding transcriptional regulator YiaG
MSAHDPKRAIAVSMSMHGDYSMLQSHFKDALSGRAYAPAPMETMGQRIRALRQAKGWNQERLANLIGVTVSAVSQWERDETKNVKLEAFLTLAEVLGTDPHYLVFGAGRGAATPPPVRSRGTKG